MAQRNRSTDCAFRNEQEKQQNLLIKQFQPQYTESISILRLKNYDREVLLPYPILIKIKSLLFHHTPLVSVSRVFNRDSCRLQVVAEFVGESVVFLGLGGGAELLNHIYKITKHFAIRIAVAGGGGGRFVEKTKNIEAKVVVQLAQCVEVVLSEGFLAVLHQVDVLYAVVKMRNHYRRVEILIESVEALVGKFLNRE